MATPIIKSVSEVNGSSGTELAGDPAANLTVFDAPFNSFQEVGWHQWCRQSAVAVGLVLNFLVFKVIVCSRQLRAYPRHIFWAAVLLVNTYCGIQNLLEFLAVVYQNRIICQIFSLLTGTEYSLLLLFLFYSACDRYLAVTHYDWYQRHVTNDRVIALLLLSSSFVVVLITSPFWLGFKSISHCTINLTHLHVVLAFDILLGVLCIVLHLQIFRKARSIIREYSQSHSRPITLRFNSNQASNSKSRDQDPFKDQDVEVGENGPTKPAQFVAKGIDFPSCFPHKPTVSSLEARAAWNMSVSILPFWVCAFPISCNTIAIWYCFYMEFNCETLIQTNQYMRDLFLVHSIYNPAVYMALSLEFRRSLSRLCFRKT